MRRGLHRDPVPPNFPVWPLPPLPLPLYLRLLLNARLHPTRCPAAPPPLSPFTAASPLLQHSSPSSRPLHLPPPHTHTQTQTHTQGVLPSLVMVANPTLQYIMYEWLTARLQEMRANSSSSRPGAKG